MKLIITKHAKKRIIERLGLAKRAHKRHIEKVLGAGKYMFRNMFDKKFYMKDGHVEYVFSWTSKLEPILVTVCYDYSHTHMYKQKGRK